MNYTQEEISVTGDFFFLLHHQTPELLNCAKHNLLQKCCKAMRRLVGELYDMIKIGWRTAKK